MFAAYKKQWISLLIHALIAVNLSHIKMPLMTKYHDADDGDTSTDANANAKY